MDKKYLSLKDVINWDRVGRKYEDVRTGDIYRLTVNDKGMLDLKLVDSCINDEGLNVEEIYYIEYLFELEFVEVK